MLAAALHIAKADHPHKTKIISERSNFPTDLYIAEALCKERGYTLQLVEADEIAAALQADVAVLMLTHVNYRTGAMHDMQALTAQAHAQGTLTVWDLAHSAGAVPVNLNGSGADFAVGCGYKYLNGGPGAPAFVWVHPQHTDRFWQPLAGWWGHAAPLGPFLQAGLGIAEALGGMAALRQKSLALTGLFMQLVRTRLHGHGFGIATPAEEALRGSQVSLTRAEGAYAIVQALIARGVIGDFRAGDGGLHADILRFGFTPLYIGYADVWHAAEHLCQVMQSGEWLGTRFAQKNAVT